MTQEEEAKESMEKSIPIGAIYIRLSPMGPVILGGLIDEVLADRDVLTEEGAALLKEAHYRAVEAILNTLSNAPGGGRAIAVRDEARILNKFEKDQDLDFFDNVNTIEEKD